jgi:hypothetical protein
VLRRTVLRWALSALGVLVLVVPTSLVWIRLGLDRAAALATVLALAPALVALVAWAVRSSVRPRLPAIAPGRPEWLRPSAISTEVMPRPGPSPASFQFDAYVSYVDRDPDAKWVSEILLPRLQMAGLRVAVSGLVERPGVARLVGIEEGIVAARRTLVVLSTAYLADGYAEFENVLAQTIGVEEGTERLLPVRIADLGGVPLPGRLRMLTTLDMTRSELAERELKRLLEALTLPASQ